MPTRLELLEQELHEERGAALVQRAVPNSWPGGVSLNDFLINYMMDIYTKSGEYKFTTADLHEECLRHRPGHDIQNVRSAIARLKQLGTMVKLEKVGDSQAFYFTLKEIVTSLATESKSNGKVEVSAMRDHGHGNTETTPNPGPVIPKPSPPVTVSTAGNPFDKVNSQLGEILSKVNGLTKGYSELVQHQNEMAPNIRLLANYFEHRNVEATHVQLYNADEGGNFPQDPDDPTTKFADLVADTIMRRYGDAMSGNGSEDYKSGIREGIRMAVELGIKIE